MKKWLVILVVLSMTILIVLFFRDLRRNDISGEYDRGNTPVTEVKRSLPEKKPAGEEMDLEKYRIKAVDGRKDIQGDLSVIPDADSLQKLADGINGKKNSSGEGTCGSIDLPPKIKEAADQLKDMVDSFDDATLKTTRRALNNIPFFEAEPSKAKIRMSGDRVTLKVTIPADDIRIGKN